MSKYSDVLVSLDVFRLLSVADCGLSAVDLKAAYYSFLASSLYRRFANFFFQSSNQQQVTKKILTSQLV